VKLLLFLLAALLVSRPRRRLDPTTTSDDGNEFARYQRAVSSQNRRLDALEGTLGALCAIEFAAMTYLLDKSEHAAIGYRWLAIAMLVPIIASLVGWFGFPGAESPNLHVYDTDRRRDREAANRAALAAMVTDYRANRVQLAVKERLRGASVLLAAIILLVELAGLGLFPRVVQ